MSTRPPAAGSSGRPPAAARPTTRPAPSGPGSRLRPPGETSRTVAGLADASRAERRRSPRDREIQRNRLVAGGGVFLVLVLLAWGCSKIGGDDGGSSTATKDGSGTKSSEPTKAETEEAVSKGLAPKSTYDGWVDPKSSGEPWSTSLVGQLTFRGNPTRSYYGLGPVPEKPKVLWRYPESGGMCSSSPVGNTPHSWCGSGWTGQPSVWEDENGDTKIAVGTYDQAIHFINAADGSDFLQPFDMGDIIKGSVTRDPEGEPLLYSGSRADFHILGLDRPDAAADLWSMSADNVSPVNGWNDDWDSSPLMIDDYLFDGGENGQWYIIKLNRSKGADGLITVDPQIVFNAPSWDEQLTSDLAGSGSRVKDTGVENSLAISGNTVYFANSGGLVQGWDITNLKTDPSSVKRVFRFWTGDDTDASVVVDKEGMLYVASERERGSTMDRSDEVGQLMKLDPTKPDDPLVWKINDPPEPAPHGDCEEPATASGARPPSPTASSTPAPTTAGCSAPTWGPARSSGRRSCPGPRGSRRWWWTRR